MKTLIAVIFLFLLLTTACMQPESSRESSSASDVDSLFAHFWEGYLEINPLSATQLGDNRFNHILANNISQAFHAKSKELYQNTLNAAAAVDRSQLSSQQRLSLEILIDFASINLNGFNFGISEGVYPAVRAINQFESYHLTLATIGSGESYQPFDSVKDYENFLGRIDGFYDWAQTAVDNIRQGILQKDVWPKACMVKVLPQLESMLVDDPTASLFYGPIKNLPSDFSDSDKKRLTELYLKAIQEKVIPSYQALYDLFSKEYIPASRETAGVYDVPDGPEQYAYLVKFWTTTDMTPDEIFELGEKEVARIKGEMEKVKEQVEFEGSLQEFFTYVYSNPQFFPFKQDQEVIEAFTAIEGKMQSKLKELFGLMPKTPFEVRQTEEFREASASAEYMQGSADGSRPGVFYVPVIDPTAFNNFQMEDLFLHEAIPGHHYQISIQQELQGIPDFRRFLWNGAYVEGWALYSESLGKELGLYEDPYQYFGKLGAEMHRAIRLVVDVGMHTKGWTREKAIQYSLENEAISEEEAIAEIERYMVWPGQALSYKIGELKILELRERAKTTLGEKFDIKAFHNQILSDGALPLTLLDRKIDQWIESQKGS